MSQKEARRPGLVQAALSGKITNAEGARALQLSIRQFRRLRQAYAQAGVEGLLHGNRGRRSGRRRSDAERARVVELIRTRYSGFNNCHLAEKLREVEGLTIGRDAVREIRKAAGIAPARHRRPTRHRTRRLRQACAGAILLLDASQHAWFEERGPVLNLLGAIDDATGAIVALHFRPHEDLHGYTELLRRILRDRGVPTNLYGDRLNVFVRNDDHWTLEEELAGQREPTQFGHMLVDLAIGYITAHSPQAKGRIERLWETLQDRFIKELRLRGIDTVEAAEAFVPEFIADHNRRFAVPPREAREAWRRPARTLDRILACRYTRTVAADNTVQIPGRWIQVPPGPRGRSYHRLKVEVRELLDGRLIVLQDDHVLAEQPAPPGNFTLVPRDNTRAKRRAALKIEAPRPHQNDERASLKAKTQTSTVHRPSRPPAKPPAPDHIWRRGYEARQRRAAALTGRT